jgi:hypothetical protein
MKYMDGKWEMGFRPWYRHSTLRAAVGKFVWDVGLICMRMAHGFTRAGYWLERRSERVRWGCSRDN